MQAVLNNIMTIGGTCAKWQCCTADVRTYVHTYMMDSINMPRMNHITGTCTNTQLMLRRQYYEAYTVICCSITVLILYV